MKRMIKLLAIVLPALLVGCNGQKAGSPSGDAPDDAGRKIELYRDLEPRVDPHVADLPVPIGFKLDQKNSRGFQAGGARWIDHVYKGNADKFDVKRFYERQMRINRWVLVTDMFIRGEVIMEFEKESERCNIMITEGGLFSPIHIKATLWTSGPIRSKERAAE